MSRKRYRYILCGIVNGSDKVSNFRLIGANNIKPSRFGYDKVAIRFEVPDDMELTKYSCDPYSTTDDNRTLDELGYDILVWHKDIETWKVHNEFKGMNPHEIYLNKGSR